jgi:uncharacterized protein YggT (Ycf19 family)
MREVKVLSTVSVINAEACVLIVTGSGSATPAFRSNSSIRSLVLTWIFPLLSFFRYLQRAPAANGKSAAPFPLSVLDALTACHARLARVLRFLHSS